jgi:hypothetical protein
MTMPATTINGTRRHSGRGGSPQVVYQSAVEFLRARRVF